MRPYPFESVIDRKRYDTTKAELIAHDCYWDGNNHERQGRNTYLYRTERGSYFALHLTQWQGERDYIEPLTETEAYETWESLPEKEEAAEEAFPSIEIEEA